MEKCPCGRPKIRWEDNIIWDLKAVDYEVIGKHLSKIELHGLSMNFRVPVSELSSGQVLDYSVCCGLIPPLAWMT